MFHVSLKLFCLTNTAIQMIKIAIADDHSQVRQIWKRVLSANAEFNVVATCNNGQEAINAATEYSPDIILMDINMRPVNGIEATEIISKLHPSIKIIAMSIHLDEIYVKRMLKAGASGYITKNTAYEEMFDCILQVNEGKCYVCNEIQKEIPDILTT